jgi:transcription-repair coupling factor (superfamily II helicase)
LQIRGAGNIVGHAQSGHMAAVGMDMYLELLAETIAEFKGDETRPKIDPEVNLQLQAYIPEEYVPDVNQRLVLYRRIASALTDEDSREIEDEMRDRYGVLPEQVELLLEVSRLKTVLRDLLITSVDCYKGCLVFSFHEDAFEQLDHIVKIVSADPGRFKFTPEHKLHVGIVPDADLLAEVRVVLKHLQCRD